MEIIVRLISLLLNTKNAILEIIAIALIAIISIVWIINRSWQCYKEYKALEIYKNNPDVKDFEMAKGIIKMSKR